MLLNFTPKKQPDLVKYVSGPDGQGYTEVWLDGLYSRIQGSVPEGHAFGMVRNSRKHFKFRD